MADSPPPYSSALGSSTHATNSPDRSRAVTPAGRRSASTPGRSAERMRVNSPPRQPVEVQVENLVRQGVNRARLQAQLEEIAAMPEEAPPARGALAYGRGHSSRSRERPNQGRYNLDPAERARYDETEYGPYRRPIGAEQVDQFDEVVYRPYRPGRYPSPAREEWGARVERGENFGQGLTTRDVQRVFENMLENPGTQQRLASFLRKQNLHGKEDPVDTITAPTRFPNYRVVSELDRTQNTIYTTNWGVSLRQKKFSGDPKHEKNGFDVVEFLDTMNANHRQFPLSEDEFREHLHRNTMGRAYDQVRQLRQDGQSTQQLYNSLVSLFDRREKPEEAQEKLDQFKLSDISSWAELSHEIDRLIRRAAHGLPGAKEPGQGSWATRNGIKYLLNVLPERVSNHIEQEVSKSRRITGEEVSYQDVIAMCGDSRKEIELAIKAAKEGAIKEARAAAGFSKRKAFGKYEQNAILGPDQSGSSQSRGPHTSTPGGARARGRARARKGKSGTAGPTVQKIDATPQLNVAALNFKKEAENGRGYEPVSVFRCRKCRMPNHDEADCPYFQGKAAAYTCKHCHMEAYHMADQCFFRRHINRRKGEEGPGPKN